MEENEKNAHFVRCMTILMKSDEKGIEEWATHCGWNEDIGALAVVQDGGVKQFSFN